MNISRVKRHIFITFIIIIITINLLFKTGVLYSAHYKILMRDYGILICKTADDELGRWAYVLEIRIQTTGFMVIFRRLFQPSAFLCVT